MLIGALNLVLGERADRTLIRSGSDSCTVEAAFDIKSMAMPVDEFLDENGLERCEDCQLVLKRVFNLTGSNRQFINGSPATLTTLASLGEWLVDIHGPHEHQSLLHPARQLAILDAFGDLASPREAFAALLRRRGLLESEKAALIIDEKTYAQQLDLLRFQSEEISAAQLTPGEDEQVEQEYRRASNAAKLAQLSQSALNLLSETDDSLQQQGGALGRVLSDLHRVDPGAAALVEIHGQAVAALNELQSEISRYADRLEINPERLKEVEDRLNLIQTLKRKYGSSLAEVIEFGAEAARKLQNLLQRDAEVARLNAELQKLDGDLWQAGQSLSEKRRKVIPQLARAACKQLQDLGFNQSRLEIDLQTVSREVFRRNPQAGGQTGLDTVEFQFAPNPGEPPKPLRAIASSGELARVMLALKTVLAAQDQVPVLVFDEVDANVGGETANAVGLKMQQISRKRQVLCITHLPQVAAAAAAHFVVSKSVKAGRTLSELVLLNKTQRITELARMLGGQTDAARKHAEAMLRG
jgi:DNA repair protein RecN (Recombination protein N)